MPNERNGEPAHYRRALAVLDEVVHAVPPITWDDPSHCAPWTVRELIGHVIAAQWALRGLATGSGQTVDAGEVADADPVGGWERARTAASAALTADALRRRVPVRATGATATPGPTLGEHLDRAGTVELLAHAWDLAHAGDVGTTFDRELSEHALAVVRSGPVPTLAGAPPGAEYGPPRETRSDEPIDQLVALLGRDVDAIVDTNRT